MKTVRTLGRILAWFNLIYWGMGVLSGLLQATSMGIPLAWVVVVLMAAIPLNSYAALQLHKSIRRPEIPLSHNTPAGIRFVGSFVVLIGICFLGFGVLLLEWPQDFLAAFKEQAVNMNQLVNLTSVDQLRSLGVFVVVLGIVMIASALLNMRLLRWYLLAKRGDVS
jgi:hypothetical protein